MATEEKVGRCFWGAVIAPLLFLAYMSTAGYGAEADIIISDDVEYPIVNEYNDPNLKVLVIPNRPIIRYSAKEWFIKAQNADGSWGVGGDANLTALVLMAFRYKFRGEEKIAWSKGIRFLLSSVSKKSVPNPLAISVFNTYQLPMTKETMMEESVKIVNRLVAISNKLECSREERRIWSSGSLLFEAMCLLSVNSIYRNALLTDELESRSGVKYELFKSLALDLLLNNYFLKDAKEFKLFPHDTVGDSLATVIGPCLLEVFDNQVNRRKWKEFFLHDTKWIDDNISLDWNNPPDKYPFLTWGFTMSYTRQGIIELEYFYDNSASVSNSLGGVFVKQISTAQKEDGSWSVPQYFGPLLVEHPNDYDTYATAMLLLRGFLWAL